MRITGQSRIFISYSHGGNGPAWKAALVRALHVFELHHLLDVWEDGKIRVSAFWDDDITKAMNSAQLAVVLLTPEAFKSDYIVNREFPVLSGRQKQDQLPVVPVICEHCDWKAHEWIRATQAPNASNPLSELAPPLIERAFRALATEIAEKLSHVALTGISVFDTSLERCVEN